jgi:hypothetical protein
MIKLLLRLFVVATLLPLLAVLALMLFRVGAAPEIEVKTDRPGIGRRTGVTVHVREPQRGLGRVSVELEQEGQSQVLATNDKKGYRPRRFWAFWGPRQAEDTMNIVARVGRQTEEHLPVIAGKLAVTLDSLNATSNQVRETTRANGDALRELLTQAPELVRGSNEVVRDTQELAQAARRTWLLRDYIEPTQMRTLPVDSFESFGKR